MKIYKYKTLRNYLMFILYCKQQIYATKRQIMRVRLRTSAV